MSPEYCAWIAANVEKAIGQCHHYSSLMCDAFSDLRLARGFYFCPVWGDRQHWWCVASDGAIVDPTAQQFPSGGSGAYREITNPDDLPTGVCANCGEAAFRGEFTCSASCGLALDDYYAGPDQFGRTLGERTEADWEPA